MRFCHTSFRDSLRRARGSDSWSPQGGSPSRYSTGRVSLGYSVGSTVLTNAALYFITATALIKVVLRPGAPVALWLLVVPAALFAGIYAWLLFRGPFESDFERARAMSS